MIRTFQLLAAVLAIATLTACGPRPTAAPPPTPPSATRVPITASTSAVQTSSTPSQPVPPDCLASLASYGTEATTPDSDEALLRFKPAATYLRQRGLCPIAVAVVLGTGYVESYLQPDMVQGNTHANQPVPHKGYGLYQWTGSNFQKRLLAYLKAHHLAANDFYGQLGFLVDDLHQEQFNGLSVWQQLNGSISFYDGIAAMACGYMHYPGLDSGCSKEAYKMVPTDWYIGHILTASAKFYDLHL